MGDRLISVEDVVGSNFIDQIVGDGNDNALEGAGGGDTIDGGDEAGIEFSAAGGDLMGDAGGEQTPR